MKLCTSFFAALLVFAVSFTSAHAQLYWDTNGPNGGAADINGDAFGTWDGVTSNWNPVADGTGATQAWIPDSVAVFSAGSDATGTFDVTISGTQSASGVTFEEPFATVTLTGGQLTLTEPTPGIQPTISVPASGLATINSVIGGSAGLNSTGAGVLILGGANTYTGATTIAAGNIIRLGATGAIPDTSVLTLATGSTQTAFQMNGFDETVKSIATSGAVAGAPTIAIGANTLTLEDDGETQTFTGLYTTSAGGRIIKNGDGTLILNNFPAGFVGGEFVVNDGVVGVSQNNVFGTTANGSKLVINGGTFRKTNTVTPAAGTNWGVRNIDINGNFAMDINGSNNTQLIGGGGVDAGNMIITLTAANPEITVIPASSGTSGVLIFAGRVLDGGNGRGFTKMGAGVLNLGNRNNDYSGDTIIQEGALRVVNQFFNATSFDNNGPGRIGNGAGDVVLAGGMLQYNGSPIVEGISGSQAATGARMLTVTNPISMTASSSIDYFSTTVGLDTRLDIDFIFTSDSIGGSGGTLSLTHNGSCAASPGCTFRPTFTGDGFDFDRPVVISNHTSGGLKVTQLVSANPEGTQTWSADISGTGGVKRTASGGTTVLTGANSYAGGTTVDAGTLTASGASATFGSGNATVTGGTLEIASGVADAIADTAMLSISGTGIANLGTGIDEFIAALSLGGVIQASGTYGSSASSATFQFDQYFAGMGIVTVPAAGLDGDYNGDGAVDAADYVVWRKDPASFGGDPAGYDTWRANFGETAGAGAGQGNALGVGAVPEPATVWLLAIFAGAALVGRRRHRSI